MSRKKLIWHTELRKVNDLIPYEKNPRTLSQKQLEDLKRSFKKFNLVELPAINTDGKLCAGHQRTKILQLLGRGEEEIEVRVPNRKLTDNEFRDYLLTSNRSGGNWNWQKLAEEFELEELQMAGFDEQDLSNIFDDNLEVEDDSFDTEKELEKAQDTDIKPGDFFALGRHRLLCGDATDPKTANRLMGNVKADMVNDDIPYNIGLSYDKGVGGKGNYGGKMNDNKSDSDYRKFVKSIILNSLAVTKKDAHIMFWSSGKYVWLLQTLYQELGIDSKRICIWIKNNFSPTPQVAFNSVTEYVVYGTIGKPYLNNKVRNLNEVMNKEVTTGNQLTDDILDILNIWLVKRLPGQSYNHPTEKSVTLHEKSLRRCTRPSNVVLDLTAGSGSLLSACEQLKRTAYLNELEPVFCQVIINRFKKLSNEKVRKIN